MSLALIKEMSTKARFEFFAFLAVLVPSILALLFLLSFSIVKQVVMPITFYLIIVVGIAFSVLVMQDWLLHKTVYINAISQKESRTHYLIFYAGGIPLLVSLMFVYLSPFFAIPALFFTAVTLSVAVLDELKDHHQEERKKENITHHLLWMSGITTLLSWLYWGIFLRYEGLSVLLDLI